MNSIASRKPGELGESWPDSGHPLGEPEPGSVLAEVSHPYEPGAVIGPVRTARDRAQPRPTHLREPAAASLLSPVISRNARFADCSANNVGVTARFVTNPELTDDTDVTRRVLVPRVTY